LPTRKEIFCPSGDHTELATVLRAPLKKLKKRPRTVPCGETMQTMNASAAAASRVVRTADGHGALRNGLARRPSRPSRRRPEECDRGTRGRRRSCRHLLRAAAQGLAGGVESRGYPPRADPERVADRRVVEIRVVAEEEAVRRRSGRRASADLRVPLGMAVRGELLLTVACGSAPEAAGVQRLELLHARSAASDHISLSHRIADLFGS